MASDIHGRFINTAIWRDDWFLNLRESEQHLFLYLLTCPASRKSGVFQLGLMEAAFHTKIDQAEIKRIFIQRFQPDKKAFFEVGWVVMVNWLRHQQFNPNQWKAVANEINELPDWLVERIFSTNDDMHIPFERVSNGSVMVEKGSDNKNKIKVIKLNKTKGADAPVDNPKDYMDTRNGPTSPWGRELGDRKRMQ